MQTKCKVSRIGHRHPRRGVITLATEVLNDKLFIGVSYCSPSESYYDKAMGRELAIHRLAQVKLTNNFWNFDEELTHANVIVQTLQAILEEDDYPRWAEPLILETLDYPHGLKRYSKKYNFENGKNPVDIKQIVVNSEEAKQQLLLAFEYLHNQDIDTDLLAVNVLVHQYLAPDNIIVVPDPILVTRSEEELYFDMAASFNTRSNVDSFANTGC